MREGPFILPELMNLMNLVQRMLYTGSLFRTPLKEIKRKNCYYVYNVI